MLRNLSTFICVYGNRGVAFDTQLLGVVVHVNAIAVHAAGAVRRPIRNTKIQQGCHILVLVRCFNAFILCCQLATDYLQTQLLLGALGALTLAVSRTFTSPVQQMPQVPNCGRGSAHSYRLIS
jgi:hypothetical protein